MMHRIVLLLVTVSHAMAMYPGHQRRAPPGFSANAAPYQPLSMQQAAGFQQAAPPVQPIASQLPSFHQEPPAQQPIGQPIPSFHPNPTSNVPSSNPFFNTISVASSAPPEYSLFSAAPTSTTSLGMQRAPGSSSRAAPGFPSASTTNQPLQYSLWGASSDVKNPIGGGSLFFQEQQSDLPAFKTITGFQTPQSDSLTTPAVSSFFSAFPMSTSESTKLANAPQKLAQMPPLQAGPMIPNASMLAAASASSFQLDPFPNAFASQSLMSSLTSTVPLPTAQPLSSPMMPKAPFQTAPSVSQAQSLTAPTIPKAPLQSAPTAPKVPSVASPKAPMAPLSPARVDPKGPPATPSSSALQTGPVSPASQTPHKGATLSSQPTPTLSKPAQPTAQRVPRNLSNASRATPEQGPYIPPRARISSSPKAQIYIPPKARNSSPPEVQIPRAKVPETTPAAPKETFVQQPSKVWQPKFRDAPRPLSPRAEPLSTSAADDVSDDVESPAALNVSSPAADEAESPNGLVSPAADDIPSPTADDIPSPAADDAPATPSTSTADEAGAVSPKAQMAVEVAESEAATSVADVVSEAGDEHDSVDSLVTITEDSFVEETAAAEPAVETSADVSVADDAAADVSVADDAAADPASDILSDEAAAKGPEPVPASDCPTMASLSEQPQPQPAPVFLSKNAKKRAKKGKGKSASKSNKRKVASEISKEPEPEPESRESTKSAAPMEPESPAKMAASVTVLQTGACEADNQSGSNCSMSDDGRAIERSSVSDEDPAAGCQPEQPADTKDAPAETPAVRGESCPEAPEKRPSALTIDAKDQFLLALGSKIDQVNFDNLFARELEKLVINEMLSKPEPPAPDYSNRFPFGDLNLLIFGLTKPQPQVLHVNTLDEADAVLEKFKDKFKALVDKIHRKHVADHEAKRDEASKGDQAVEEVDNLSCTLPESYFDERIAIHNAEIADRPSFNEFKARLSSWLAKTESENGETATRDDLSFQEDDQPNDESANVHTDELDEGDIPAPINDESQPDSNNEDDADESSADA